MKVRLTGILAALAICFACGSLLAHHGNSAYDEKNPISITGKVTEFIWSNPHCQIYLDVKDGKGKIVKWSIESQSPGILKRAGWSGNTLKVGDQITLMVAAAKNGAPVGFSGSGTGGGRVVFADGKTISMRAPGQ